MGPQGFVQNKWRADMIQFQSITLSTTTCLTGNLYYGWSCFVALIYLHTHGNKKISWNPLLRCEVEPKRARRVSEWTQVVVCWPWTLLIWCRRSKQTSAAWGHETSHHRASWTLTRPYLQAGGLLEFLSELILRYVWVLEALFHEFVQNSRTGFSHVNEKIQRERESHTYD